MATFTLRSTRHALIVTLAELELEFSLDDGGLRALRRPGGPDVIGRGAPQSGVDVSLAETGWLSQRSFARYLNHFLYDIPGGVEIVIVVGLGPLKIYDRYRAFGSFITRRISIENTGDEELALCGVRLTLSGVCVGVPERCRFEAPANVVRPRLPIARLRGDPHHRHWSDTSALEIPAFALAPADAPGLLALHNDMVGETLACWYEDPSNPARPRVESDGSAVTLFHDIRIAERLRTEVALSVGVQALLLERAPWRIALPRIQQVMTRSRANPPTPPAWVADAAVFVTHPTHFKGASGLVEALDAIQYLGCAALCLLPVHDIASPQQYAEEWSPAQPEDLYALRSFAALAPESGGIEGLRDVVAAAHARGMRVILDLPLSGCAADSPYVTEHPDWFCLDQSGQFIRFTGEVDTFYFDWRNDALRSHAVGELIRLMEQTGIDGFRVLVARDVPPGWPLGAAIGGSSSMGVVRLIEMLYAEMHQVRPDAVLVTDLAGLLPAPCRDLIIDKPAHHMFTYLAIGTLGAAEMREWLIDNLVIGDSGGLRACFTESHHSCVSNPLADALRGSRPARMILAGIVGCGYVPLIRAGQEQEPGDRDAITRLLNARARSIALRRGAIDPDGVRCDDPAVFTVLRRHPEECVVTFLNVSPIRRRVTLGLPLVDLPDGDYVIDDLLSDDPTQNSTGMFQRDDLAALSITLAPFAARMLALRLLPLHPSNGVVGHTVHSENAPQEA